MKSTSNSQQYSPVPEFFCKNFPTFGFVVVVWAQQIRKHISRLNKWMLHVLSEYKVYKHIHILYKNCRQTERESADYEIKFIKAFRLFVKGALRSFGGGGNKKLHTNNSKDGFCKRRTFQRDANNNNGAGIKIALAKLKM